MKKLALTGLTFLLPSFAFAANTVDSVQDASNFFVSLINNVFVPLIFAVAFLSFIVGVFTYFIRGAADEEKRKQGASLVLYSIIGFALMVSVYGLVHILTGSVNLNNNTLYQSGQVPQADQVKNP